MRSLKERKVLNGKERRVGHRAQPCFKGDNYKKLQIFSHLDPFKDHNSNWLWIFSHPDPFKDYNSKNVWIFRHFDPFYSIMIILKSSLIMSPLHHDPIPTVIGQLKSYSSFLPHMVILSGHGSYKLHSTFYCRHLALFLATSTFMFKNKCEIKLWWTVMFYLIYLFSFYYCFFYYETAQFN